jgi:ribonuclease P protein component
VLPAGARIRSREQFTAVVRGGRRASSATVVVHALLDRPARQGDSPRIGFIVGRTVGGAVIRNRVRRRLRHLMRERLASIPDAPLIIVRALTPAGVASTRRLGADLDHCLTRVMGSAR